MKDAIGQEINVGDDVFHSGSRYVYAGVYEVTGLTDKRIRVKKGERKYDGRFQRNKDKPTPDEVLWEPNRVVNVTHLLHPICEYCGHVFNGGADQ